MRNHFTGDFETTTNTEDCRVWAWALCEIGNLDNFIYGNSIVTFFETIKIFKFNPMILFHNLKFDSQFIMDYLLKNEFKLSKDKNKIEKKEFTTMISSDGLFYYIKVCFSSNSHGKKLVTFYDSLKVLNFKVSEIAKAYDAPDSKLEIDYEASRGIGHQLTQEEINYIKNDVTIVAYALNVLFNQNMNKITIGSNALNDFKDIIGKKRFNYFFPPPPYDEHIRQSYKGGFTYLNPIMKEKTIKNITILDVNSLYPSVMYNCFLPYGEGKYYEGKYQKDEVYNVFIQCITCQFTLKSGKIPTIQIKNNRYFKENEYLENSGEEMVTLFLTTPDFELFFENYEVENISYNWGWKFKSSNLLFKDYIDKWIKIKIESTINENKPMRTLAKLMLNSLYGKFAVNPKVKSKWPYLNDEGIVKYELAKEFDKRRPIYIPIASFITAYARKYTIQSSQKIRDYSLKTYGKDMYIYSDTDSIHTFLPQKDVEKILEISDTELGKWKIEGFAEKGKFIRQKCYIEVIKGELNITCAGMPASCYENVTWDNFKIGSSFPGKLAPKTVNGGTVLLPIDFTIR